MTEQCLFCRIVAGDLPASITYQDDQVTAFRDIKPGAPTHVLVIPNSHIAGADELGPQSAELLSRLVEVANQTAKSEGLAEKGYRLVFNVGPDAGQSVFHLHLHVLGGRKLGWPPG